MKRNFSKAFCLLLVASLLLSLVAVVPGKAAADASGICGENITWTFEEATGTLTLSGSGEMPDFENEADQPWAEIAKDIKKVVIEDGIRSVGKNAFAGCTALTEVELPKTIQAVNDEAFVGAESLETITINSTEVRADLILHSIILPEGTKIVATQQVVVTGGYYPAPVNPTEPTTPSEEPTEPTAPSEEPTEPTAPSEEPTEPTAPSEEPTEPTAPSEEPTEPTTPSEEPTVPTEPEETTKTYIDGNFEITETWLGDKLIQQVGKQIDGSFTYVAKGFVAENCPTTVEYYQDGKLNSVSTSTYDENGNILTQHNEDSNSDWASDSTYSYDSKGNLEKVSITSSDGSHEVQYYENGQISHAEGYDVWGGDYTVTYEVYDNGTWKTATYVYQDRVSTTEYYENGTTAKITNNYNGQDNYTLFDENGQITETGWGNQWGNGVDHYVDGVRTTGEYYQNGVLYSTSVYETNDKGNLVKDTTTYVGSNEVRIEYYEDGQYTGKSESFDANGTLIAKSYAEFDENGNTVKRVTEYLLRGYTMIDYYENNQYSGYDEIDANGNIISQSRSEFDEDGNLLKRTYSSRDGYTNISYFENGLCVKGEGYDSNGVLVYTNTFEHDENGREIKQVMTSVATGATTTYYNEYDENGNMSKRTMVSSSGHSTVSYYENDRCVKEESFNPDGSVSGTHYYEYDENGNQTKHTYQSSDGRKQVYYTDNDGFANLIEYYDENGRMYQTEERERVDATTVKTTTHTSTGTSVRYYSTQDGAYTSENYDLDNNMTYYSYSDGHGNSYTYSFHFDPDTGAWSANYWGNGIYNEETGTKAELPENAPEIKPVASPSLMAIEAA